MAYTIWHESLEYFRLTMSKTERNTKATAECLYGRIISLMGDFSDEPRAAVLNIMAMTREMTDWEAEKVAWALVPAMGDKSEVNEG